MQRRSLAGRSQQSKPSILPDEGKPFVVEQHMDGCAGGLSRHQIALHRIPDLPSAFENDRNLFPIAELGIEAHEGNGGVLLGMIGNEPSDRRIGDAHSPR